MSEKIIIENLTELPMVRVLDYVKSVVVAGKISETSKGEQYCFISVFDMGDSKSEIVVAASKNKGSDRFQILWGEVKNDTN